MSLENIKSFLKVIGVIISIITVIFSYIRIAAPSPFAQSLLPSFLHIFIPVKSSDLENNPLFQTTINLNSMIVNEIYKKELINSNKNDSFENRVRHGQDRIIFADGSYVNGLFEHDKLLSGTYYAKEFTFDGTFKDNNEFDYGKITTINGYILEGTFQSGKLQQGQARIQYSDGLYNGEINQGNRNGKGILIFPDGAAFEGTFLDDSPFQGELIRNSKKMAVKFIDGEFVEEKLLNRIRFPMSP